CLLIDTDICKIPGYPLLKCQKVVADRFSEEVDGLQRSYDIGWMFQLWPP
ncbi:hypothetical protein AVEN_148108-1, partial [Araneus ventricosus]